jgi:tight adherence protein C
MVWTLTAATFLVTVGILLALVYAFSPSETAVADRVSRILEAANAAPEVERTEEEKGPGIVSGLFASLGRLLPALKGKAASRSDLMSLRAGYRTPDVILAIRALKILSPIVFVALTIFSGLYKANPLIFILTAAVAGYMLPELWLNLKIRARQTRLRLSLPDGLDLLVICVEVGLGIDQALLRVANELKIVHPELSDELQLVNLEMRVGKSRTEALRELARRTGLDDIKALVAMLVQTERFGTSIAASLRIHSEDLRTKRRQRAEEMSAKTSVKMVPALVFFIFPALMVVILGPAFITLFRQLAGGGVH